MLRKFFLATILLIVFIIFIIFKFFSKYYIDYIWFESQGYPGMWWHLFRLQSKYYILGVVSGLLLYFINYFVAFTRSRFYKLRLTLQNQIGIIIAIFFVAFIVNGSLLYQIWDIINISKNAPKYGLTDPIYKLDASFYMFDLNLYQSVLNYLEFTIIASLILSSIVYLMHFFNLGYNADYNDLKNLLKLFLPHLCPLLSILVLLFSASIYLDRYTMIYEGGSDRFTGADYVDLHARVYTYTISAYIGVLVSVAIFIFSFKRNWKAPAIAVAIWISSAFIFLKIYPNIVKVISVNPNEYIAQKPYIENSMKYTLAAYNLDKVERLQFPANENFTQNTILNNNEVLSNIRLWDYQTLGPTLKQLQEIRQYYEFYDVDVDRYEINNKLKQVMVSVRELNKSFLPSRARTWESRHLQYTHGYGLSMIPANETTKDGQPVLWIRDFPPRNTIKGLPEVKRPEIYFGQKSNDYILTNTGLKEIDYPLEQKFAETVYSGKGGVTLGKGFKFLMFAWNFDTWKFLVSSYLKSESKILYHRNIYTMVKKIAPYFIYDTDPYIVLGEDGRLYWVIDAYTSSERFPYSAHFDGSYLRTAKASTHDRLIESFQDANYIRNPIKVTIDAYDGTVNYYLTDDTDPIALSWAKTFPKLIKPLKDMPDFLVRHLRYPENLFLVQAAIYGDYHMRDALSLYNLEDRWQIPKQIYGDQTIQIEPYYIVTSLPSIALNSTTPTAPPISENNIKNKKPLEVLKALKVKEEFILMLPFIPSKKENMIAWMAVRNDYRESSKNFGELLLFDFPSTRQIYGPLQIESRIDQDPDISRDLRLWNQQDSKVIRGNMLVVPLGNTILYIKPIYLQSTNTPFPELRRVVVADDSGVVMGENLEIALQLLANQKKYKIDGSLNEKNVVKIKDNNQIVNEAKNAIQKAKSAAAKGDWILFGKAMNDLENNLNQYGK